MYKLVCVLNVKCMFSAPSGELYGPNEMLKGFLIECGPENTVGESETSVGQFVALDSSIQKHVCGQVGLKCL